MQTLIILCAKYLIFVVAAIAAIYWLTLPGKKKAEALIFGFITALVALLLAKIGGMLFYDTRPFVAENIAPLFAHANNNGFPSDHTLLSSVLAVAVFYTSKKWGVALMVLAVLVGTARVLAHIHHPVDIAGSVVMAIVGGLVAYQLTPYITKRMFKDNNKDTADMGD